MTRKRKGRTKLIDARSNYVKAVKALSRAKAILLHEQANALLRDAERAGDAGLWGETIRHAMVDAAVALRAEIQ